MAKKTAELSYAQFRISMNLTLLESFFLFWQLWPFSAIVTGNCHCHCLRLRFSIIFCDSGFICACCPFGAHYVNSVHLKRVSILSVFSRCSQTISAIRIASECFSARFLAVLAMHFNWEVQQHTTLGQERP